MADTMIHDLLLDAQKLDAEKQDLQTRRGANRDLLRLLRTAGKGTPDEHAAISEFYPDTVRGPRKVSAPDAAPAAKK